jgi:hypothetical protein
MEVNLNPGLSLNAGASQPVTRRPTSQPADNAMSFEPTQALEKLLLQTSPVRPEAVAKASSLVADENYPSDGMLNQIAGLLANKLGQAGDTSD